MMKDHRPEPPVPGILGAYFFLFLLFLWPVTDFMTTALPFQWGRVEWRYASVGLMGSYIVTPLMGIVFSMGLAVLLRHWRTLRFLAVFSLLGGAFLLLAMVSLGLDTVQLWKLQPPDGMPSLRAGGLLAELKLLSGVVTLILFGIAGWKMSRRFRDAQPAADKTVVRPPGRGLKSEKGREG